jgi:hypothetical protein
MMGQKEATNEEISDLLVPGRLFNVWVFSLQNILDTILSPGFSKRGNGPEWRGFRLAAGVYERFCKGEISRWRCLVCHGENDGLKNLSCIAIADRFDATDSDHGVAVSLCLLCVGGDPAETVQLVAWELKMTPFQEGHA